MPTSPWPALIQQLQDLPDPRVARTRRHNLIDILLIAICAVICGAEGWDDFVSFGRAKKGHGRIETRRCDLLPLAPEDPLWGDVQAVWKGLRSRAEPVASRENLSSRDQGPTQADRMGQ